MTSPAPTTDHYPGPARRLGAYLIDGILVGIVGFILAALFAGRDYLDYADRLIAWQDAGSIGEQPTMKSSGLLIATLLTLVVWFIYRIGLETRTGQTLGKKALGIRVVTEDGSRITALASFQRNSWYIVVFLFMYLGLIGWFVSAVLFIVLGVMIARSPYRQHTFDQWSKSYVVNAR